MLCAILVEHQVMAIRSDPNVATHRTEDLRFYQMFAEPGSDLKPFLNDDPSLYLEKNSNFWKDLAREIFSSTAVVVRFRPSRRLMAQLS